MDIFIKVWNKAQYIIGIILGLWVLSGILGIWGYLPNTTFWLILKVLGVILLLFVLIIRYEEVEDKPLKKQLTLVGTNFLGWIIGIIVILLLGLFIIGTSNNSCQLYPWAANCP
jgi:hypothetical protein